MAWEDYLTGENWLHDLSGGDDKGAEAREAYEKWAQQAVAEYKTGMAQGRGDITDYYKKGMGIEAPFLAAGEEGEKSYLGTLGIGDKQGALNRFQESPGYKFAMQQGNQALQRKSSASGLTGSGSESKELMRYGQGVANQEYGKYQSRLSALGQQGQQMASLMGSQTMQTGGSLADLTRAYEEDIGSAYTGVGKSDAESYMTKKDGILGILGTIGGGVLGGIYGGPAGAGVGAKVGGSVGGAVDQGGGF